MLWLLCDIGLKFDVAQVCRYWRDVALHNYIFWSSISVCDTKSDCGRVPIALQRSGSTTMLHIEFWFTNGRTARDIWPASALTALVPYVARIEELDVDLASSYSDTLSFRAAEALFNSNLEFLALKTLCLVGPDVGDTPRLSLKVPRLRFLDFDHIHPEDPNTLLVPSLEHIRFCESDLKSVETLSHIFTQCPRVGLVVLQSRDQRLRKTVGTLHALCAHGPVRRPST
ncbi:hypothetical protein DFH08DRAFT_846343 [Mycena albidolilacea]|uniref:F-box domain-containing protein n=1 Tax=Mycena albidolilacea TaxID=1033008 RepID=A0AAD7AI68_9AGAR|nr:hypothetical protein DFH08DRAFT_846343 [Mycena albidolilacea]